MDMLSLHVQKREREHELLGINKMSLLLQSPNCTT